MSKLYNAAILSQMPTTPRLQSISMTDLEAPTRIVPAAMNEYKLMGDILGDAFEHDPVMNWGMPNTTVYAGFFQMLARQLFLPHQLVHRDSENRGASMWLPPGVPFDIKISATQIWLILRLMLTSGLHVAKRLESLQAVMSEHHPKQPHYYLQAIGARQAHQGRGVGSALLKTVTPICDAANIPAYLESSSEHNIPLYERHGFEITGEHCFEPNGATLWFMWRKPHPQD